tara:strand:- start:79 stop:252 length:174 start_codon:yes stop_codon:yes gene_type:complete
MNDNRTEAEKYTAWVNAVNICHAAGWKCKGGWMFESPAGVVKDLSATDLTLLNGTVV